MSERSKASDARVLSAAASTADAIDGEMERGKDTGRGGTLKALSASAAAASDARTSKEGGCRGRTGWGASDRRELTMRTVKVFTNLMRLSHPLPPGVGTLLVSSVISKGNENGKPAPSKLRRFR